MWEYSSQHSHRRITWGLIGFIFTWLYWYYRTENSLPQQNPICDAVSTHKIKCVHISEKSWHISTIQTDRSKLSTHESRVVRSALELSNSLESFKVHWNYPIGFLASKIYQYQLMCMVRYLSHLWIVYLPFWLYMRDCLWMTYILALCKPELK